MVQHMYIVNSSFEHHTMRKSRFKRIARQREQNLLHKNITKGKRVASYEL